MKFGFSSYSFNQKLASGEWTILDVIDWVGASEGEHLEFAVLTDDPSSPIPNLATPPAELEAIRTRAAERGVTLSNLAVGADLDRAEDEAQAAEVERLKQYVDFAVSLGIALVRHDVAMRLIPGDDSPEFDRALTRIAPAAKEVAQYAAAFGVTTSVENHGFFVQASERVRRVIHAVDEKNFATTLDVGNFVCVDEDPAVAVANNLPYASIVHFKDFYRRTTDPGEGWFRSRGGAYLRGAIVGNGDLDLRAIARAIKESGFDGFASIEFEGAEDCLVGCARGLANAKRLYDQA